MKTIQVLLISVCAIVVSFNTAFAQTTYKSQFPVKVDTSGAIMNASGTTFAIQSLLSESILTDQPDLITSLLVENPFVKKHIQKYLRNALAFSRLVFDRDDRKLKARFTVIKSHVQEQQNLDLAYKQMYQIIEQLKD